MNHRRSHHHSHQSPSLPFSSINPNHLSINLKHLSINPSTINSLNHSCSLACHWPRPRRSFCPPRRWPTASAVPCRPAPWRPWGCCWASWRHAPGRAGWWLRRPMLNDALPSLSLVFQLDAIHHSWMHDAKWFIDAIHQPIKYLNDAQPPHNHPPWPPNMMLNHPINHRFFTPAPGVDPRRLAQHGTLWRWIFWRAPGMVNVLLMLAVGDNNSGYNHDH